MFRLLRILGVFHVHDLVVVVRVGGGLVYSVDLLLYDVDIERVGLILPLVES